MWFMATLLGICLGYIIFRAEKARDAFREKKFPHYSLKFAQHVILQQGSDKNQILVCVGSVEVQDQIIPLFQRLTIDATPDIVTYEKCALLNSQKENTYYQPQRYKWIKRTVSMLFTESLFKEYRTASKVLLADFKVALTPNGPYLYSPIVRTFESLPMEEQEKLEERYKTKEEHNNIKKWYYISGYTALSQKVGQVIPEDRPLYLRDQLNSPRT